MTPNIDGFVHSIMAPGLQPGETILGSAHMRRMTGGDYSHYDEWIGVTTDRRLVLFRTEVTGVGLFTVLPKNLGAVEWWYQDLEAVGVRDLGASAASLGEMAVVSIGGPMVALTLSAYDGLRPTTNERETYVIPRDSVGLAAQAQTHAQFGPWLKSRVDARAFPLTPDRQQFHAQRQQQQVAAQAFRQAADAQSRAAMRSTAPYLLAILPLVSALVALIALGNARSGIASSDQVLNSPAGQEPSVRATYLADRALYEGRVPVMTAWLLASLVATGAVIFWASRRNARPAGG